MSFQVVLQDSVQLKTGTGHVLYLCFGNATSNGLCDSTSQQHGPQELENSSNDNSGPHGKGLAAHRCTEGIGHIVGTLQFRS